LLLQAKINTAPLQLYRTTTIINSHFQNPISFTSISSSSKAKKKKSHYISFKELFCNLTSFLADFLRTTIYWTSENLLLSGQVLSNHYFSSKNKNKQTTPNPNPNSLCGYYILKSQNIGNYDLLKQ